MRLRLENFLGFIQSPFNGLPEVGPYLVILCKKERDNIGGFF